MADEAPSGSRARSEKALQPPAFPLLLLAISISGNLAGQQKDLSWEIQAFADPFVGRHDFDGALLLSGPSGFFPVAFEFV